MTSEEYRLIIKRITISAIKKGFPGLKKTALDQVASVIARNVHARMYGANVDNVDSPLWSSSVDMNKPTIDASQLLKDDKYEENLVD